MANIQNKETAVFGGGCFWCTEAAFSILRGIISVMPGYAGGTKQYPTYEDVCGGGTGHAEVIRVDYDPRVIPYPDLLMVFFATHDPTTKDRQGNDVGTQYRSIILYTSDAQKMEAEKFIGELETTHPGGAPIVTEIKPLKEFYEAEGYHQKYFSKNPKNTYCQLVINPKLEKVQKQFAELLSKAKS